MPRLPRKKPTSRLNLEMSLVVRQRLERLRDETDADSLSEVIRKALAVYEYLWDAKSSGASLLVKDDSREKELLLL